MVGTAVLKRMELKDYINQVRCNPKPSELARQLFDNVIKNDAELLLDLVTEEGARKLWLEAVSVTTLPAQKVTRKSRPQNSSTVVRVNEHIRAKPSAFEQVHRQVALMLIDGVDIRDLTIGGCKTLARKRTHEARVLRKIAEECTQIGDHVRVGDQYTDDALKRIIDG